MLLRFQEYKPRVSRKQQILLDKLQVWSGILIARTHGFEWCIKCCDGTYGRSNCNCPVNN
jgi:hypothetical protein